MLPSEPGNLSQKGLPAHPISRRTAVQVGSLGLLGLAHEHLGLLRTEANVPGSSPPSAKNVIFIFLSGGLSHHDTFDMKPNASSDVRGEFRPIRTTTPGLQICEHLPLLAQRSHRWSLCRSLTHSTNEHSQGHHIMLTGRSDLPPGFDPGKPKESDWPSITSVANAVLKQKANLPPAIVLPEKLIHRTGRVIPGQFAGHMGPHRDPFLLTTSRYNPASYGAYPHFLFHHRTGKQDGNELAFDAPSLQLPQGLDWDRLRDRIKLRQALDDQQAWLESAFDLTQMDRYQEMAVSLLTDPKTKQAFEVHSLPQKTQERYGKNAFGWSLLLAKQLVEAGVSLVQVNLGNNETWDNHEAIFPNLRDFLLPPLDQSLSALLDDLHASGLLDETLVVMASEFGRTPKIFKIPGATSPGRDHWGAAQTVFFSGGGVSGGRVIGSTDGQGGYPASDPQTPENFAATIYQALGIPPEQHWYDAVERPHPAYHGKPIEGLRS